MPEISLCHAVFQIYTGRRVRFTAKFAVPLLALLVLAAGCDPLSVTSSVAPLPLDFMQAGPGGLVHVEGQSDPPTETMNGAAPAQISASSDRLNPK
jgi:hypothetical protein